MVVGNNWTMRDESERFWVGEYGGGGGLSEKSNFLAENWR